MAILSPTIEVIKRQKVQPTEGEWTLLNFLLDNLDNTYEIYFQPFSHPASEYFASGILLLAYARILRVSIFCFWHFTPCSRSHPASE
jgi:hypothetical protein